MPPERKSLEDKSLLLAKLPPYYVDIYGLGRCIEKSYSTLDIDLPKNLSKYTSLMLHQDMKKRPSALKLSTCALFTSDHIKLLENIDELALKSSKEALDVIGGLEPTVASISQSICSYKLLPNINRILQMALNDFPNRDSRESSRQSIQLSVMLLSKMAEVDKVDPDVFENTSVPLVVQLWAMSDRSVRTCLLQSLKQLAPMTSSYTINRSIFDHLLSGFSDSNAKLRETTLTSLMCVVDKLDDHQLNDKLVRCIVNLQNDQEASIRTNSTIFLGKIAPKLKEVTRARVLCASFAKAMKDSFLHCRIAGLKTSNANVKLFEPAQMVSKIIPQASILTLEKSGEVRSLALTLLDSCLECLRQNHETMLKATAALPPPPPSATGAGSLGKDGKDSSPIESTVGGWTSFLSKTIESATDMPVDKDNSGSGSGSGSTASLDSMGSRRSDIKSKSAVPDVDMDMDFDEEIPVSSNGTDRTREKEKDKDKDKVAVPTTTPSSQVAEPGSKQAWTAELESLLLDDDYDEVVVRNKAKGKKGAHTGTGTGTGVQKLTSDKWEDF